jgi:hypothetical protein
LGTSEALTLNGTGISGGGALINSSATASAYSGSITLGSASSIASSAGMLVLGGTVDGAYDLAVLGPGAVTFGAAIGSGTALASFFGDATTTLSINGGLVKTNGLQSYFGHTTFGAPATLTSSGGNITASGLVAASGKMTFVAGSGNISIDNALNDLTTVEVTSAGTVKIVDSNAMSVSGISSTGTIDISTVTGNLTLTGNITTADSSASAVVLNAESSKSYRDGTGGNIIVTGSPTISTGDGGRATLYSGSVDGSTGLGTIAGSGSGHFRYDSDEAHSGYSTALETGTYAIYREQPTITVTADDKSVIYGTAPVLTFGIAGNVNGDNPTQALSGVTIDVGGLTSTSGNHTAGSHSLTPFGGTSLLGYLVSYSSPGTLTVSRKTLAASSIADGGSVYGSTVMPGAVSFTGLIPECSSVGRTAVIGRWRGGAWAAWSVGTCHV